MIIPPTNLNLPPLVTILNQDIQFSIERIDLNEGQSNQTRRVVSINTSTNIPVYNSTTRPAISATTLGVSNPPEGGCCLERR